MLSSDISGNVQVIFMKDNFETLIKIFYLSNIKIVIGHKLLKINVRENRRDN